MPPSTTPSSFVVGGEIIFARVVDRERSVVVRVVAGVSVGTNLVLNLFS